MIVQIYALTTPEDAVMCAEKGADYIGLVTGNRQSTEDEVSFDQARAIFAAVPPQIVKVALTTTVDPDNIAQMVNAIRPDVLHLSVDLDRFPPDAVSSLRPMLPPVRIMQAIPVAGPQAVEDAIRYEPFVDLLLLDSTKGGGITGATGHTHDWSISRRIVEAVSLPVILAGGLHAGNVAEAIRTVRPWGVDSFTRTSFLDNKLRKDPALVEQFIRAAKEA